MPDSFNWWQTDGGRSTKYVLDYDDTAKGVPKAIRGYIGAGMSMEGSGDHLYDRGQSLCDSMGEAARRGLRGFVRDVSKPHDFGNSWSYDHNVNSSTYGYRLEGGGFASLGAKVTYEVIVQTWSFATMPPMAGFTAFARYGDYLNPYTRRKD